MKRELRSVLDAAGRKANADALWRARIVQAHEAGASLREIAAVAGVSHVQVGRIVKT